MPMKAQKTWFINHIRVLDALVNPNGITNHLYKSYFILKAVFHSSPSFILI